MKLVFAIVHDEDTPRLMAELNKAGFRVTKLNSSGGFLRCKYSSSRQSAINTNIAPSTMGGTYMPYPVDVTVGGATVFVVNVEQFEKM